MALIPLAPDVLEAHAVADCSNQQDYKDTDEQQGINTDIDVHLAPISG
jgi:hypothetical protein